MANEAIPRAEARAEGLLHYISGLPCKNGHIGPRLVSDNRCVVCHAERAKAFYAKNKDRVGTRVKAYRAQNQDRLKVYRAQNKERISQYNKAWNAQNKELKSRLYKAWYSKHTSDRADYRDTYYKANAERLKSHARLRRQANIEERRAHDRAYHKENADKKNERVRKRRILFPETVRARDRDWKKRNRELVKWHERKRRALELDATGSHTIQELQEILKLQKNRCANPVCRIKFCNDIPATLDHIIALTKGGSEDRRNLQYLCQPCNSKKYNLDPIDFARRQGMLI